MEGIARPFERARDPERLNAPTRFEFAYDVLGHLISSNAGRWPHSAGPGHRTAGGTATIDAYRVGSDGSLTHIGVARSTLPAGASGLPAK